MLGSTPSATKFVNDGTKVARRVLPKEWIEFLHRGMRVKAQVNSVTLYEDKTVEIWAGGVYSLRVQWEDRVQMFRKALPSDA